MQEFEYTDDELERQRLDDKAWNTSLVGSIITPFALFFQFINIFITTVSVATSRRIKTRVHTHPGPFAADTIGLVKGSVDVGAFVVILASTCVSSCMYRRLKGNYITIPIFSLSAVAHIIVAVLTFLSLKQEGIDGIVGLKESDPNRFGFWTNRDNGSQFSDGNGLYYYNSDYKRALIWNAWNASGAFEAIFGVAYLVVGISLFLSKRYSDKM